jgi:two-component system, NarL family, response regulator DevR
MRVVIADGHPTMRLGLKGLLLMTEMRVVGETGDGEEALHLVKELRPGLVILGLNLGGELEGVEVCRKIKALPKPPRVLVHTVYNFTDGGPSSLLAGADSYIHMHVCCEELLDAIRRTAAGEQVWLLSGARGESDSRVRATPEGTGPTSITPKEREIMKLILRGCSNREIAEELYLSLSTVKTHVRNMLRKLGLKNRRELFRSGVLQT